MSKESPRKQRLDVLLKERGLAASREKAQALILSGHVFVEERKCDKAGTLVPEDADIRVKQEDPYVSRGAYKLLKALDEFRVSAEGRAALDVGASTGGFTQVLLERGARSVTALDVGHNQLDWKIRSDPRVKVLEKVNARHLKFEDLGETFGIIVIDVSFISLELILPPLLPFLTRESDLIALIKPQFEAGRDKIQKGGIVREEAHRAEAVEKVKRKAASLGLDGLGTIESPIKGTTGNIEYLAHWRKTA